MPADVASVRLYIREFPKPWREEPLATVPIAQETFVVTGLAPTSTYEFKSSYVNSGGVEGAVGPTTAADTLAAGCVPKDGEKRKSGCTVQ